MASIYRSSTMKTLNKVTGRLFLLIFLLGLCTLSGCGMRQTKEETQEDWEETVISQSSEDEEDPEETSAEDQESEEESEPKEPVTMAQLFREMGTGGPKAGEPLPDTVLWFNATYAPLTHSNGWDWRLLGGMEALPYNQSLQKYLLERDWKIEDRESALEQLEWLEQKGQRETYRKYLKELQEKNLLDLDEDTFLEALANTEMDGYLYRYYMVYTMYHEGRDENDMAAWDLCRINQLCADFYFCKYMSYEEAMDVSLRNSLRLQKMYSSWEEMVGSYMLGYQFWQSDPCATDDSPTLERYRYYDELLEMEDGPYSLDWNMTLEKEW